MSVDSRERWRKKAKAGDPKYTKFMRYVENATAQFEGIMSEALASGGKSWQAAATWLERRNPDLWMRSEARSIHANIQSQHKLGVFTFKIGSVLPVPANMNEIAAIEQIPIIPDLEHRQDCAGATISSPMIPQVVQNESTGQGVGNGTEVELER